jgi:hypothetical protein
MKKHFPSIFIDNHFKAEFGRVYRFTRNEKEFDLYIEGDFPRTPPRLYHVGAKNPGEDLIEAALKATWSQDLSLDQLSSCEIPLNGHYRIGSTFPFYLFTAFTSFSVKALNPSTLRPWQDLKLVLTDSHLFQVAENKHSGYLVAYGTLKSLKFLKTIPSVQGFSITWRGAIDYVQLFSVNSLEIIEKLINALTLLGVRHNKSKILRKTIKEEDVGPDSIKKIKISEIEAEIIETELDLEAGLSKEKINLAIDLYQKAIEYYSALGDDKFINYFKKMRDLMADSEVLKVLNEEKMVVVKVDDTIVSEFESQEIWPEQLEIKSSL